MTRKPGPGWLVRSPRRLQMAVFILVGGISLLGVFGIENAEMRRRHAALERDAIGIAASLRQLDTEHEIYLRACAALFAAQGRITAQEWRQLQGELGLYRQGSLGVGWAPRVPAGQARPGSIDPGHDAYPVAFTDPANHDNAAAPGFDMYSEPIRRVAMDKAAMTAGPVATGRVRLVRDDDRSRQTGFLVYMPVFGQRGNSRPPRGPWRGPLRGYVYMPFRASDLLDLAVQLSGGGGMRVAAYDGQAAPDRLMASAGFAGAGADDRAEPATGRHLDTGRELVETVDVAGRPWQLVVSADRHRGLSLLAQITILSGLVVAALLAILIGMTYRRIDEERVLLEWKASEAGIRNSLTRELNHRVKNTLATVLSIVTLTRRRETDLDSYVESLSGRIRALSATHDLLVSSEWSSIALRQIIVAELAPHLGATDEQVSLEGPDIRLAPNDALTLGLAIHELSTNAAKYGALSVISGRIRVSWHKLTDAVVEIRWEEMDGPLVTEPAKRGFGRELIERILARELDSPVKLSFAPGGLQCVFRVPLRQPAPFVLRTAPPAPVKADA